MIDRHLGMDALLAVRDGDRSEPAFVEAHRHVERCADCRAEVARLHQVTARLKALPTLEPSTDQFPAVRARLHWERRHRLQWRLGGLGIAAAALLAVGLVGNDLARPPALDAEQQLDSLMTRSQQLEQALHIYGTENRVLDGRTVEVVIDLEDRIARIDAHLQESVALERQARLAREASLWQERVGLMNALVNVHLTKATTVDL
jgi:hypothetical protein